MVGRTDDDILASPEHDTSVAVKRRVLKSGTPEECEVTYTMPEGRAVYAIRIFPTSRRDQQHQRHHVRRDQYFAHPFA